MAATTLPTNYSTTLGNFGSGTITGGATNGNKAAVPTPNLTGLPQIDAMIAAQYAMIAQQGKIARRSLLLSQRKLKQEAKQSRIQNQLLQEQIAALQVQPAPPVTSPNMAEVTTARRQTAIDAANRYGMRKSILAGETGGFQGSVGTPTRSSILG